MLQALLTLAALLQVEGESALTALAAGCLDGKSKIRKDGQADFQLAGMAGVHTMEAMAGSLAATGAAVGLGQTEVVPAGKNILGLLRAEPFACFRPWRTRSRLIIIRMKSSC